MTTPPVLPEKVIKGMLDEWKRGMLTFWTLGLLLIGPRYGLDIKKEIETSTHGKMRLGNSTIYQLLRRLEKKGLMESRWERSTQGPPRAYYQITTTGKEVLRRYIMEVFMPGSPIAGALGDLVPKIMGELSKEEIGLV
jgi:DNA-binding PadR family transcriptional regulator